MPARVQAFRVTKMLERWTRENDRPSDSRELLSPAVLLGLKRIWSSVCSSLYKIVLFHTASPLEFFDALRISELILCSHNDHSKIPLRLDNVCFIDSGIYVRV